MQKEEISEIKRNVYALLFHKIGSTVVFTTDNLIISKFISLITVGYYSNYTIVGGAIQSIIAKIFNAIIASVGNLVIDTDKGYVKQVFYRVLFINVFMYAFVSVCLFSLIQNFIVIWLGEKYIYVYLCKSHKE